jgi:hypothetical protein
MKENGNTDTQGALQQVLDNINEDQRNDLHQGRKIAGEMALKQMLDTSERLLKRRQSGTPIEVAALFARRDLESDASRWRVLRASGVLLGDPAFFLLTLQIKNHVLAQMIVEEIYDETYKMELTAKLLKLFGEEEVARLCEEDPEGYCRIADCIQEETTRRWGTESEPGEGTTWAGDLDK